MGFIDPTTVDADTTVVPSVSLSERYDSNVFFAPREFLAPGTQIWDLVTTVAPQVKMLNTNRRAITSINAGATGNVFVYNPELNFISTNLDVDSTLDGLISEFIPHLKLQILDSFRYTPEPSAFLTGVKPQLIADPFTRGTQLARANTFTNVGYVKWEYPLTQTMNVRGDYSYSLMRVGSVFVQTGAGAPAFFDTNLQKWSAGPSLRLTQDESINLNYEGTQANQSFLSDSPGQGQDINFSAHGFVPEYVKQTPRWTAKISGGGTLLQQGNLLFFTGGLTLTNKYDPSTNMLLTVSRTITPSYFVASGAFINTTVQGAIQRELSRVLTLTVGANYAIGETAPTNDATMQSYSANALLAYQITRSVSTSLSYTFSHFKLGFTGQPPFLLERYFGALLITVIWP